MMPVQIPQWPVSPVRFKAYLNASRLFNGPVSEARAGALWGLMYEALARPHTVKLDKEVAEGTLERAGLSHEVLSDIRYRFQDLTQFRRRKPGRPLSRTDKRAFTDQVVRVLNLPWNGQVAGAFLAFANMADEVLPTAAAGFFPTLESFSPRSVFIPSLNRSIRLPDRNNNFYRFFNAQKRNHYRKKPVFRRFKAAEAALERRLSQRMTVLYRSGAMARQEEIDVLPELFQAYHKMARYTAEVALTAPEDHPARALIL